MNPFGALEPEEVTAVAFLPAPLQPLLAGELSHLQLVGAQGCGKTTALTSIPAHFRHQGRRAVYSQTGRAIGLNGTTGNNQAEEDGSPNPVIAAQSRIHGKYLIIFKPFQQGNDTIA